MLFQAIFQSKNRRFPPVCGSILCILDGWESYVTPRQQSGVRQGDGGALAEIPLFVRVGRLRLIYGSQQHGHVLFYSHLEGLMEL
jgi:hypothetical protein